MQLKHLTVAATSLVVAGVTAQSQSQSNGPPTVKFNTSDIELLNGTSGGNSSRAISLTQRQSWCTGQRTACNDLCQDNATSNGCDSGALTWNCTCGKNNSAPGLEYYAATMPGQICATLNGYCMADAAKQVDAQDAQATCNKTYVCSNLNISSINGGSSNPSASQTGSSAAATSTPSGTGSSSSSQSSKAAAAALHVSEHYGAAMLGGTIFAALGLFL